MREISDPNISSVPSINKCLALPTPSIVFAAVSSRVDFVEWHQSSYSWVSYANDFPPSWSGSELVNGSSSGVPIKKGAVKKIGSTIPLGKGKEKKGQKGAKMKPDIEKVLRILRQPKWLPTLKESEKVASVVPGGNSRVSWLAILLSQKLES